MNSKFSLLEKDNIIDILDGDDNDLGKYKVNNNKVITLSMPYLSGPNICDLAQDLHYPMKYDWNNTASRWVYMDQLINNGIKHNEMNKILSNIFNKSAFADQLSGQNLTVKEINNVYEKTINSAINKINSILCFNNNKLIKAGNNFKIISLTNNIHPKVPSIETVDRDYIRSVSKRAFQDIQLNHCDSALTKARTILEETFMYVIEKSGNKPVTNGKINQLYQQVKRIYSMGENKNLDKRINMLLSGFEKIIRAISQMRDKDSDAHGEGDSRIIIKPYHALLFVNTAIIFANFILDVEKHSKYNRNPKL